MQELEQCANLFFTHNLPTIRCVTAWDAPYQPENIKTFSGAAHTAYARRVANVLEHSNDCSALDKRKYELIKRREHLLHDLMDGLKPGMVLDFCAAYNRPSPGYSVNFPSRSQCIDAFKATMEARVAESVEFKEIRRLYEGMLSLARIAGRYDRTEHCPLPRLLECLFEGHIIGHRYSHRKGGEAPRHAEPDVRNDDDAEDRHSSSSEHHAGDEEGNDVTLDPSSGAAVQLQRCFKKNTAASTSDIYAARVVDLSPLMQRLFGAPCASRDPTCLDIHAKSRSFHCSYIHPQLEEAKQQVHKALRGNIYNRRRPADETVVVATYMFIEQQRLLEHRLALCMASQAFADRKRLADLVTRCGIDDLDRDIRQVEKEHGFKCCVKGLMNERDVWGKSIPALEECVIRPRLRQLILDRRGAESQEYRPSPEMLQHWISKCFSMSLSDEERQQTIACAAYPERYEERVKAAEENEAKAESDVLYWRKRKDYLLFKCFAENIAQLPFYALVNENTKYLTRSPLSARSTPEAINRGYTWTCAGELDGILLDLCTNDVLAVIEMKANACDIPYAIQQRNRFFDAVQAFITRAPVVPVSSSPPRPPGQPHAAPTVMPTAAATTADGVPLPLTQEVEILRLAQPHPIFDAVFPLSGANLKKSFADATAAARNWVVTTNLWVTETRSIFPDRPGSVAYPPLPRDIDGLHASGKAHHFLIKCVAEWKAWDERFGDRNHRKASFMFTMMNKILTWKMNKIC